jgi:mono/diheme cytochrome c family protein
MSEEEMKTIALTSLALLLIASEGALAEEPPKDLAAAGHEFALKVCANCHVVEKGQKAAPLLKPPAPSFTSIVARREVNEPWLRAFLSKPHGNMGRAQKMPNPQLVDFQIDKIVAYFQLLSKEKQTR